MILRLAVFNLPAVSTSSAHSSAADNDSISMYHAVLIDFGKARDVHHLTDIEKLNYFSRYPHIAPEVVHGEHKYSSL